MAMNELYIKNNNTKDPGWQADRHVDSRLHLEVLNGTRPAQRYLLYYLRVRMRTPADTATRQAVGYSLRACPACRCQACRSLFGESERTKARP